MQLTHLKSGTDIRGTALDNLGNEVTLTERAIRRIIDAFALWVSTRVKGNRIAVGHDSRLSSESIKTLVVARLVKAGYTVLDCGLCSTPSMFMATKFSAVNASASVMITASHHPSDKNGLKFFLPSGGLGGDEISEIIRLAEDKNKLEKRKRK